MNPIAAAAVHEQRNEEIEVLRAVAVIFVLFHHYQGLVLGYPQFYGYVEGMWSGVDLFFCISGYVIARSLLPALQGKRGRPFWREVAKFWIKRWYRIIPAAWLWIVALMIVIGLKGIKGNSIFWYDTFAAMFQYANLHFYRCTVDARLHCGSFQPYWSLSLEEQFYLVIPFAAFLFRNRLWWFVAALALAQLGLARHHWTGLSGFLRTDAIALGVLLAVASRRQGYRALEPKLLAGWAGPVVSVLLLVGFGVIAHKRPFPPYMGAVAILSAVLVWIASYAKGYLMPAGWLRTVAVTIGARSFSIYLAQIVCFLIARKLVERILPADTPDGPLKLGLTLTTGLVVLALLVEASYRLVEVPWRRRGRLLVERMSPDLVNNGRLDATSPQP
ncbi:acyltransferase family protein [Caenimonas terrae]|uniref:Acyltransferase family protein n=1 Tax=Caenimonas terrae TaxID=696074 RepID=A0ABW0N8V4_9BURK